MSLIQVVFSSGIETEDTKRVATSIPIVCFSPDVLHWRPVKAVHLLSESLYFYSRPSRRWIKSCACMRKYEKTCVWFWDMVENRNKDSLRASGQQDECRNTFCTSSFNPNRKYYLDHAHITIYFSPMIRILLPYKPRATGSLRHLMLKVLARHTITAPYRLNCSSLTHPNPVLNQT